MLKNKILIKLFFLIFLFNFNFVFICSSQVYENEINRLSNEFNVLKILSEKNQIDSVANIVDSLFCKILSQKESFETDFSSLKNFCSILISEDLNVKIFTWNIFYKDEFEYKYFGYIQYKNNEEMYFYELKDNSSKINNPHQAILNASNWFGCLYYEIISKKAGKNTIYTLLGWDGNNFLTTRKIIEVLTFENNKPNFSYEFEIEKKIYKRLIFEYSKQSSMSLKWNEKRNMIIWDHLSPSNPKFEGIYQYYGPDFSYDALVFKQKQWLYLTDVKAEND